MIVARVLGGLELVTQPDHARLASDFLALWRGDGLPAHPRRDELLAAVREHDNGWQEVDAAPRVDSVSGEPLDFRRLPRDEVFELWRRACDRLTATPYAAALVAYHALEIHRDRAHPSWAGFRLDIQTRCDEARLAAGLQVEDLAADYRFLALADTLSLVACGAFEQVRCRGHHIRRRGEAIELDPFPLAGTTTFRVPVRVIGAGPYGDAVELIAHLAAARWIRRPIRLVPVGP